MSEYRIVDFSNNKKEKKIILTNEYLEVGISTVGATLVNVRLLKSEDKRDVVWGFDSADDYLANRGPYFGVIAGRVCGRIDKGRFTLNGVEYQVPCNNNGNSLHGGVMGFDSKSFTYEVIEDGEDLGVKLHYLSVDGEEGYPGNLALEVKYILRKNTLHLEYHATTDKDTIINLTNHAYFNLEGHNSRSVLNHSLEVHADAFLGIDEDSCPRGHRVNVEGTPFDFRTSKLIKDCVSGTHEELDKAKGVDHFFIFNKTSNQITLKGGDGVCTVKVNTNQPGANIYSGNFLDGTIVGKEGVAYPFQSAVCLETQNFNNDININENPTTILRVGETYESWSDYTFEVNE